MRRSGTFAYLFLVVALVGSSAWGSTEYFISGPTALPSGAKTVTVSVNVSCSEVPVSLNVAIDYSELIFSVLDVTKTLTVGGNPPDVFDVEIGPKTCTTALNDPLEGYVAFHIALAENAGWQRDTVYEVARLTFTVFHTANDLAGETVVRLRNVGPEQKFQNTASVVVGGEIVERTPHAVNLTIGLPGVDPPRVARPEDVQASFRLSEAAGRPGDTGIPIYFYVDTNTSLESISAGFTYDHEVLALESLHLLAHMSGEAPYYEMVRMQNPEEPGIPYGAGLGVMADINFIRHYYPTPGEPVAVARFTILPTAPEGASTDITFAPLDYTVDVINTVVFGETGVTPGTDPTQIQVTRFNNGKILVFGEVSPFFLRGDANTDHFVNIADAVSVLQYLFANGQVSDCPDAADANDDGRLDIGDPIAIISTLFGRQTMISGPYPALGVDPTADTLGPCDY
jgi:hypothetical protein